MAANTAARMEQSEVQDGRVAFLRQKGLTRAAKLRRRWEDCGEEEISLTISLIPMGRRPPNRAKRGRRVQFHEPPPDVTSPMGQFAAWVAGQAPAIERGLG